MLGFALQKEWVGGWVGGRFVAFVLLESALCGFLPQRLYLFRQGKAALK